MRKATRFGFVSAAAGAFLLAYCCVELSCVPAGETKSGHEVLPSRVLIVRHAEKPPDAAKSVHLSGEGRQRADALPELFAPSKKLEQAFPKPDFIFATKDSGASHRPVETVTPLSQKLKLPINSSFRNDEYPAVAREIFTNPKYSGKTILICWHHGTMPQLARALKATNSPASWKATAFDRVWEINYGEGGQATFRDRPQRLMVSEMGRTEGEIASPMPRGSLPIRVDSPPTQSS